MIAKNVTSADLQKALDEINTIFDNNIIFKRGPDPIGRRFRFTLTVKNSRNPGGRRGFSGKRVAAACWHVHGEFFDALFNIVSHAEIISNGRLITENTGNWIDRNIGSVIQPMYYSEACDC